MNRISIFVLATLAVSVPGYAFASSCSVQSAADLQNQLNALSSQGGGIFIIPACAPPTPTILLDGGPTFSAAKDAPEDAPKYIPAGFVSGNVSTPALHNQSVLVIDQRNSTSGHTVFHSNTGDGELRIEDWATAGGEGPSLVLWNDGSNGSGTGTGSIISRYGSTGGPYMTADIVRFGTLHTYYKTVGATKTIDHQVWDPDVDFQLLQTRGVPGDSHSRLRIGSGGTVIVNPTDASGIQYLIPYEGQTDPSSPHRFIVNAPEGNVSAPPRNLLDVQDASTTVRGELRVESTNSPLRLYSKDSSGKATLAWSILTDFPGTGQFTIWGHQGTNPGAKLTISQSGALQLQPSVAEVAPKTSLFVDQADGKLKFKDANGRIGVIGMTYQ